MMKASVSSSGSITASRMMRAEGQTTQAAAMSSHDAFDDVDEEVALGALDRANITHKHHSNRSHSKDVLGADASSSESAEDHLDESLDNTDGLQGLDDHDMEIGDQIGADDNLTDATADESEQLSDDKDKDGILGGLIKSVSGGRKTGVGAPVDCVWADWGPYQACSLTCGWGHTNRERKVKVEAKNNGRKCVGSHKQIVQCKYRNCAVQCKWGNWGAWTRCAKTCGGGTKERTRAKVVIAQWGGKDCVGTDKEETKCNSQPCPVLCEWATWGPWSECQRSCGGGLSVRDRGIATVAKHGGKNCSGPWLENRTCNTQNCPVHCVWATWGSWGKCSKTCGNGTTVRTRAKKVAAAFGGTECEGDSQESTSCNGISCPVNCKWGNWGAWSNCSKSCGKGERSHTRKRLIQAKHGGADCGGLTTVTEACNTQPCPADCTWATWGHWSNCSKSCGGGTQTRIRNETAAKHGGLPCNGSTKEETVCNTAGCPVDCKWSHWTPWEKCTVSCGGGMTTRKRTVLQQAAWGGKACSGTAFEEENCNIAGCSVDCKWDTWGAWSPCTKTCGTGVTTRTRTEAQKVQFGGAHCIGGPEENKTCNTHGCPVNCAWGDWSGWTACTATCGNGTTSRVRSEKTREAFGGLPCNGSARAEKACNTEACPVDCVWGLWGSWTHCTKTCGGGKSTRSRAKVKEAMDGGHDCIGEGHLERDCNAQPCPVDCRWEEWNEWSACSVTCGVGVKRRARPKYEEQFGGKTCEGSGTEDSECFEYAAGCPASAMTTKSPPVVTNASQPSTARSIPVRAHVPGNASNASSSPTPSPSPFSLPFEVRPTTTEEPSASNATNSTNSTEDSSSASPTPTSSSNKTVSKVTVSDSAPAPTGSSAEPSTSETPTPAPGSEGSPTPSPPTPSATTSDTGGYDQTLPDALGGGGATGGATGNNTDASTGGNTVVSSSSGDNTNAENPNAEAPSSSPTPAPKRWPSQGGATAAKGHVQAVLLAAAVGAWATLAGA